MSSNDSFNISRLLLLSTMSILPKNNAIEQFCYPAVFNIISEGQTVYKSCVHLGNIRGLEL